MKKVMTLCAITLCIPIFAGCATSLCKQAATSSRSDVFIEVSDSTPVAAGESELSMSASLKTHREFDCPINPEHSHGTPDYRLLINIDGQALPITGEFKEENLTGSSIGDPESGIGIRYTFRKRLRLSAGQHRLIVSLPDDGIAVTRDIQLDAKSVNSLGIEPVYNLRSGARRSAALPAACFNEGIKSIRLNLNGREI
ncbi:hypothetical protein OR1_00182 [Geobacter sp. OR-1]|uniref:hypothetical protein n=1 Tax=Geobacter sp. OR-1 TaxID=1266765 RepID=UPI000542E146|nr:hypothetical protein [Geobacter sp. OR-1]GAM07913.1 hypothetical protein OR1_00182 [Geobacter sp. OR-1]